MVLCVFLFVSGGFYLAQHPLCCHSVGIPFSPDRYSRPLRLWALLVLSLFIFWWTGRLGHFHLFPFAPEAVEKVGLQIPP